MNAANFFYVKALKTTQIHESIEKLTNRKMIKCINSSQRPSKAHYNYII